MHYTALSDYYDSIMSHVNYHDWEELIAKVLKKYSPEKNPSILELGAGTGTLGKRLKKKYNYTGSDLSFNMSVEARKKNLPVICADAKYSPVRKKYDIIIFLYDGINYLNTLSEYKTVFESVACNLKQEGIFLFDITTETNSIRYFYDYLDYKEIENTSVIRHSYYNPKKHIQYNDFTFFSPENQENRHYLKRSESHVQKVFKPEQIESVIPRKLFSVLGIWDGYSMHNYNKYSERIHFLLKKVL
jgi:ubiquinone/menaquinone biosynthesis C-methylase UbiE